MQPSKLLFRVSPFHPVQMTYFLIGLIVALFLTSLAFQISVTPKDPIGYFGINRTTLGILGAFHHRWVLEFHEWYRLIAPIFLHVNFLHLFFNGLALWMIGRFLEPLLGPWVFLWIFMGSGLGGTSLGLLIQQQSPSVGASGAIMGLFTAAFMITYRLPPRSQLGLRSSLLQMIIPSLIPIFMTSSGGGIDYVAHFGGAIAGVLLGACLLLLWPNYYLPMPQKKAFIIFLPVSVALFAFAFAEAWKRYEEFQRLLF